MLDELIKLSKNRPQYVTNFPDGTVVSFHLLTFSEYNVLDSLRKTFKLDNISFFEEIYNICVSDEYKNIGGQVKAGIPASIGEFIWNHSKDYAVIEDEIELARLQNPSDEIYEQMKLVICLAQPSYLLEALDNLDRPSLIKLFVRSENLLVMKTNGEYKPINTKKLRAPPKQKINFAEENAQINKEFGNGGDTPWERNANAHNLLQIREQALRRSEQRKERIKNG